MAPQKREKPFWYLRRGPARVQAEVDEEIQAHLQMRIDELHAQGMSIEDARRDAVRRFGNIESTRRYCREQDVRRESAMQRRLTLQDLGQDISISLRSLARAPILTLTILLTVGLGIGATTVIFAAIEAAFLRPLPYRTSRTAGVDIHRRAAFSVPPLRRRLPGARGTAHPLREHRCVHGSHDDVQRGRRRGGAPGPRRVVVVLPDARARTGPRPRLHRSGCETSHRPRCDRESRVLAAAAREPPRRTRFADSIGWRGIPAGWRAASACGPPRAPARLLSRRAVQHAATPRSFPLLGRRTLERRRQPRRSGK